MVSIGPPGGNGTIILIGRSGYFCCAATRPIVGHAIAAPAPAIAERTLRLVAMTILPKVLKRRRLIELTPTGRAALAPKRRTRRISEAAVVAQTVRASLG